MNDGVRSRVEAQGFLGLDDRMIGHLNYWLRLSPAICMIWAAIGTTLESAPLLWALAPFALLGVLLPGHPFNLLYRFGVQPMTSGLPTQSTSAKVCLLTGYPHDCDSRMEFSIRTDVGRSDLRVGTGLCGVRKRKHRILCSFFSLWADFRKTYNSL